MPDLSQREAKLRFEYRDGDLIHKAGPRAGQKAGTLLKSGYVQVSVGGRFYRAHRVIWAMHYGDVPEFIDHINRNRADNRLNNLRTATKAENAQNRGRTHLNTSGVVGVSFCKRTGLWQAQIKSQRQASHLGRFAKLEDAAAAYREAKARLHKFQPVTPV